MDVQLLFQCFEGTLNHSGEIRHQAESKLKELSSTPGFLGACLDIVSVKEVPESIKLSASLYLKNKIRYGWSKDNKGFNELLNVVVDNDEKPVVREMLIKALVSCSHHTPSCVRMLQPALETIVSEDYPKKKWDSLLEESFMLLNSNDLDSAHIGILCLAEIFRTYRWVLNDDRVNLEHLIVEHFDSVLNYANQLLASPGALENPKIGEMIKLIIKIYKFITYQDLPHTLQSPERFVGWANLHVAIIESPLPSKFIARVDEESRRTYSWVKAKKWAYANMLRIFQRYASESLTKKFSYDEFKNLYVKEFFPNLLQLYFQQFEQWTSSNLWLSSECLCLILNYIEHTFTQKSTWPMVKSHYPTILEHIIFPILCPSQETLEMFEDDPREYIHRHLETWNEDYSPDLAAVSLLVTAVHKRFKTTLEPTLTFVTTTLNSIMANIASSNHVSIDQAVKIESCLRIISNISDRLSSPKSPYHNAMEEFLHVNVFPFFQSEYGFLRARVCELCSKLSDYEFKNESSLSIIYQGVMHCFNEESDFLPVKLLAAFALQTFVHHPVFQEPLRVIVVSTMESLLKLSNEFESDVISGVIREFVEQFSKELQPFGVDLMNNLVQQFLKLAIELNEASKIDISTYSGNDLPDESDKEMAALSILSTIISILLSFENSTEILRSLEQSFFPAADFILKNGMEDFYREVCEFVENSTFLLREVSSISWKILEIIGECNRKEDSMVSFYLEDFMMAISNYLIYGKDELKKNNFYTNILFEIYQRAAASDENDLDEMCIIFELSQKMILALGETIPESYLHMFLKVTVDAIKVEQASLKQRLVYGVNAFNVILAALVYFPVDTLTFLHNERILEVFFEVWIKDYIPKYTRVIDIKLSIMTILMLLTRLSEQNEELFQLTNVSVTLASALVALFNRYPAALKTLQEKRKEFTTDSFSNFDAFDNTWNDHEYGDEEDALDEAEEYLKFLNNEADNLKLVEESGEFLDGDYMDELEEDPLSGSVIDDVNVYQLLATSFNTLQNTNLKKYNRVLGSLTADEQQSLARTMSLTE